MMQTTATQNPTSAGQPPQWGVIPPPPVVAPPPAQYAQPPIWGQQQPQAAYGQQPQPQPQQGYYAAAAAPVAAGSDEVKTLWIGDLQYWMDENYVYNCFVHTGEVVSVKLIRDKNTGQIQGYGFIEFQTRAAAERVLQTFNGQPMPNVDAPFRLNWTTAGDKRDDTPDYTIFVGDLASDVTDYILQETFRAHYPSVKGAKVVTDKITMRSKGYGFVKFGDPTEQARAMTEMNGMFCSTRQMRIGSAANKKSMGIQEKAQPVQGAQSENDPNNTTIFVGGLDPNVTDEILKQVFSPYGEVVHVKIPVGKRCGFVQFANRSSAEDALQKLQGTSLGGQSIRLSWGRSPSNKQPAQDQTYWGNPQPAGGNYYGYGQGYEAYGYSQPVQDPNSYAYGAYGGYSNYQQQQPAAPQQQQ